jgi:hypothetical protein
MAVAGLALGVAGAFSWHYYEFFRGPVTWVAYATGTGGEQSVQFSSSSTWWPEALLGPVMGVALGLIIAVLLARRGWRLTKGPV